MSSSLKIRRRGSPLAMLAVLLGGWVTGRAATWDTPLAVPAFAMPSAQTILFADDNRDYARVDEAAGYDAPAPQSIAYQHLMEYPEYAEYPEAGYSGEQFEGAHYAGAPDTQAPGQGFGVRYAAYQPPAYQRQAPYQPAYRQPRTAPRSASYEAAYDPPRAGPPSFGREAYRSDRLSGPVRRSRAPVPATYSPTGGVVSGHQLLMREAFGVDWHSAGVRTGAAMVRKQGDKRQRAARQAPPPFVAQPIETTRPSANRWSLDVYGFYRQGSSALSVTQGRMPIYGANQVGANLQWRARPSSSHDPRLFARAYHALVDGGESEVAAGVSARPIGALPIRAYGELRVTRNPGSGDAGIAESYDFRPAGYAVTEIPRIGLPLGIGLEAYAAGGYVGGNADTYFVDGQASLTRQLLRLGNPGKSQAAFSFGGGVWGGAQKDASRVDVGPTMRLDVNIGEVPARVSVDYREQVAGDAEPGSGVAATVSTQF